MRLSVIVPFNNELKLIDRAVRSALIDVNENIEIVIGNDGAIPKQEVMHHIGEDLRPFVKIVPNNGASGPGGARNAALDASDGDLIAFLDADDYWLPGKLNAQLSSIAEGATFVVSRYAFDNGKLSANPASQIETPMDIFHKRGIGTSTVMITRALLGSNRFRSMRFAQDIDFWYLLSKSDQFHYVAIDRVLAVYSTNGSTSNKLEQLIYFNHVLKLNKVGYPLRAQILGHYSVLGVLNHYIPRLRNLGVFRREQNK